MGKIGEGLAEGEGVWLTYPKKFAHDVIYFQGRPVPTIGGRGKRWMGVCKTVEAFDDVGLIACEVVVLGEVPRPRHAVGYEIGLVREHDHCTRGIGGGRENGNDGQDGGNGVHGDPRAG